MAAAFALRASAPKEALRHTLTIFGEVRLKADPRTSVKSRFLLGFVLTPGEDARAASRRTHATRSGKREPQPSGRVDHDCRSRVDQPECSLFKPPC
jgi:hypothetical protein